ncbi:MAG: hypothetical protein JWP12_2388 [Bacteroidetes bacterium]|nr:hypothetical protein [Bacteroidota bacterium]
MFTHKNCFFACRLFFCFAFAAFLLQSCKTKDPQPEAAALSCNDFCIQNFNPVANWQTDSAKQKTIFLDYVNSVDGFTIPTVKQVKDGVFFLSFDLKNTSASTKKFYYKIYYQNESYKFPEQDDSTHKEHPFAEENFYGSWEDITQSFKQTEQIPADNTFHQVKDYFRIVGNPRAEERYSENGQNNRWKRNPRVGNYSFLLVVSTEEDLKNIPTYIQNIHQKNKDHFANPYYYFLFDAGKDLKSSVVQKSDYTLKVTAQPNLGSGVYISDYFFPNPADKSSYCSSCGQSPELFQSAPFQQFIDYVDASTKMYNIPVIGDVIKDNYSKLDYNWNKNFYQKDELIPTYIRTAKDHPCQTVFSDSANKKIVIKNPKTTFGDWKKESVGIITRQGLTYGKYRVKVKMTELLNKNGVWNGLTNAIWLITQGGGKWNYRRNCNNEGYMETYWGGRDDKRVPAIDYSEIDFEILKTPPYCPENTFPPIYKNPLDNSRDLKKWNVPFPDEIVNNNDDITVACTNWDMACREPKKFGVGCNPLTYEGNTFYTHRWDHWYRALTEKKLESDDELFQSNYFYFEIDWRPTEIIWRIGPEPDKMRVVGYMNDEITSIPNNQMLLIITQEYHNTKWWPGAPYSQDNIPFPLNDIFGEVYDLTIE